MIKEDELKKFFADVINLFLGREEKIMSVCSVYEYDLYISVLKRAKDWKNCLGDKK